MTTFSILRDISDILMERVPRAHNADVIQAGLQSVRLPRISLLLATAVYTCLALASRTADAAISVHYLLLHDFTTCKLSLCRTGSNV